MAIVARGKVVKVEENTWESHSGPRTDTIVYFQQEGQEKPGRFIGSYKIGDQIAAFAKSGAECNAALYPKTMPGKRGPWTQVIVLELTAV